MEGLGGVFSLELTAAFDASDAKAGANVHTRAGNVWKGSETRLFYTGTS